MSSRTEIRREQIFQIGAELFARQGYERTSLQEVADRLGLTKPALYYYFNSKQELLFAIISFVMEKVYGDLEAIVASDRTPEGKLEALIEAYVDFFTAHPNELTILVVHEDSLEPELRAKFVTMQTEYRRSLRKIVEEILSERGESEVDPTSLTFAIIGAMNWIFRWYDPKGRIPPKRLASDFLRIFAPPPGRGKRIGNNATTKDER